MVSPRESEVNLSMSVTRTGYIVTLLTDLTTLSWGREILPLQTAGGKQEVRVIGEPDLYRLIID